MKVEGTVKTNLTKGGKAKRYDNYVSDGSKLMARYHEI
jgi:hypothetical protein